MPSILGTRRVLCAGAALGFLVAGCSVTYDVPRSPVYLPAAEPIDMAVALRLDEALCTATWEKHKLGDHYVLPIGSALCMNAEAVARKVFTETTTVRNESVSPTAAVDAVLIPSLAAIERDRPATISSTQTTSILFNWTLNEKSGDPIWVTTIAGEGKGPMGFPLSEDAGYEQTERVLGDVFRKSLREISGSKEIRAFAAERRQSNPQ